MNPRSARLEKGLIYASLALLTAYLALQAFFSLQWRVMHDAPLIHYPAFLIDRFGYTPYVDIFTNTFPGTLMVHLVIGKTLGYGDGAFRLVDLVWLALLLAVSWGVLQRFGKRAAWGGVVLFGLSYLQHGPMMTLQRDYIGILPVAAAVLAAMSGGRLSLAVRAFLVGLFFGLATMIKPHLGLGLPVVLLFMLWEAVEQDEDLTQSRKATKPSDLGVLASLRERFSQGRGVLLSAILKLGLLGALGLAIPLGLLAAWVVNMGAWETYRDMVSVYLPLYLGMTGSHVAIEGIERWLYLLRSWAMLGRLGLWLTPAALGLYLTLFQADFGRARKREVALVAALLFTYSIYVVFGGKFWAYHWMPFQYFIVLLAALALIKLPDSIPALGRRLFPAALLALVALLSFIPTNDFYLQLFGHSPRPPNNGRVDEIAAYLRQNLEPGEMVQQLDWTGGATQAMLLAEAPMATPYMEDYVFYHHVSDPYIQKQRQNFIAGLIAAPPRYIIDVSDKPRPRGEDASLDFPELRSFIAAGYAPVVTGAGYIIYERQD